MQSISRLDVQSSLLQVFSACKPILRRDTTTAIYLLPSILICVLCEAPDHQQQITTEVLAVMNQLQEKDKDETTAPSILSIEIKYVTVAYSTFLLSICSQD